MNRSANMRAIRSTDTIPEMTVRKLAHGLGYRFRLHRRNLPGNPDLVFPSRRKVIFVHGCFWHSHSGCKIAHRPKTNLDYWTPKLERNRSRDIRNLERLSALGWKVLVVWECQMSNEPRLRTQLAKFLES